MPTTDESASKGDGEGPGDVAEELGMAAAVAETVGLEPRSVEEARKHPDRPKWKDAIEAKLRQLDAMGTWEIADKFAGVNIVGSKWVFKVKKDVAGNVEQYKVRLVA